MTTDMERGKWMEYCIFPGAKSFQESGVGPETGSEL